MRTATAAVVSAAASFGGGSGRARGESSGAMGAVGVHVRALAAGVAGEARVRSCTAGEAGSDSGTAGAASFDTTAPEVVAGRTIPPPRHQERPGVFNLDPVYERVLQ